jgi:hypothetical protein
MSIVPNETVLYLAWKGVRERVPENWKQLKCSLCDNSTVVCVNVIMKSYCTFRELSGAESLRQSMTEQLVELRREVTALEHQLAVERAATEAEKRRTMLLQVRQILYCID